MAHGTRPARLGTFLAMSVGCCLVGQAALASEAPSAPLARAMSNGHLDQKGSSASESAPLSGAGVEGRASATAGSTDDLTPHRVQPGQIGAIRGPQKTENE